MFIRLPRAASSGHRISEQDAAIVKGMILRGDRQSDIAAYFCVNGGRIAEINKGKRFAEVLPQTNYLPEPGPYVGHDLLPLLRMAIMTRGKSFVITLLKTCLESKHGDPPVS